MDEIQNKRRGRSHPARSKLADVSNYVTPFKVRARVKADSMQVKVRPQREKEKEREENKTGTSCCDQF